MDEFSEELNQLISAADEAWQRLHDAGSGERDRFLTAFMEGAWWAQAQAKVTK